MSKLYQLRLFLLFLAIYGIVVYSGLLIGFSYVMNHYPWHTIIVFGVFFLLHFIAETLEKKLRVFYWLNIVFINLFQVFFILVRLTLPGIYILAFTACTAFIGFGIPFLLMLIIELCTSYEFPIEMMVFLPITIGTIGTTWSANFSKKMPKILRRISKRFSDIYIYSNFLGRQTNMLFYYYLAYFLFISLSVIWSYSTGNYLISREIDDAITKAFLVFLAFTNMRTKYNDTDLEIEELYNKTMGLILRKTKI